MIIDRFAGDRQLFWVYGRAVKGAVVAFLLDIVAQIAFAFAGRAMPQDDVGAKIVLGSLSRFA